MSSCIVTQVDGEFTLNENICDVDGMNVVSEAFFALPNAPADLIHLPNNPYSPPQLFFINAAQVSNGSILAEHHQGNSTVPVHVCPYCLCSRTARTWGPYLTCSIWN